jgi:hypothetical protein
MPFDRSAARLSIGSIDNDKLTIHAQYNPKEIELGMQVSWEEHHGIQGRIPKNDTDVADLEFTGWPSRTMSLELFLDGYEDNKSIEPVLCTLQQMAAPRDEFSTDKDKRRPHVCLVVWASKNFPTFRCVIESIAVKYTMFSKAGEAMRATCSVKLKETRITRR